MEMSPDFRELDGVLHQLLTVLGTLNVAFCVVRETVGFDKQPVIKVTARPALSSEPELWRVLSAGRRTVRQIGTDARFWTEVSDQNVVQFCFMPDARTRPSMISADR